MVESNLKQIFSFCPKCLKVIAKDSTCCEGVLPQPIFDESEERNEAKMKCLNCDGTFFEQKKVQISTEHGGEPLDVVTPAYVCKACGEPLMDSQQMNVLMQAAAEIANKKV